MRMQKKKKELGLIGLGSFGKFMIPHLRPYFNISAYNRSDKSELAKELNVPYVDLETAASKDVVILCVPVQFLEEVLLKVKDFIQPKAMVVDVSSVKVKPLQLLRKHLASDVEIIGTHPLFGPQSGKNGIEGLNFVLCPEKTRLTETLYRFFSQELKLNVLVRTPEVHDKQMAYVQALTHFVGRAVNEMDIPDVEQKTQAYQYLLNLKQMLGRDSMDLFYTIENENPYAKDVREHFMRELKGLHDILKE